MRPKEQHSLDRPVGAVQIEMRRDRDGTFDPVIVRKMQRRLTDVDAVVLSLLPRA